MNAEFRLRSPDGGWRWTNVRAAPIRNPDGTIRKWVGMNIDISDRKRLEESQERLLALVNNIPSLVFLKDEAGKYVYLNSTYEKQYVNSPDWYGKSDYDFWPKESAEVFRTSDAEVLKADGIRQFLEDSTDRRGQRHCWLCYKFPFSDSQGRRYVGGIGIDAIDRVRVEEELKQRTEELQTILDTAPVPIFLAHDPECRKITGNPAAQMLLNLPSDANVSKSAPADERPTRWQEMRDGLPLQPEDLPLQRATRGEEIREFEMDLVFEDGTTKSVVANATPIRDKNGHSRGGVATLMDVTDRKRAEAERGQVMEAERNARAEAERAVRMKDEFLSTISHELRNPLNALIGWTQLLAKGSVPVPKAVDVIRRSSSTLAQIISDLLDMSRIVSGKTRLKPEPTDLAGLIGTVLDGVRVAAEAKKLDMQAQFDPDLQLITCDPNRIQQVMHNLVGNAVKFTPDGGKVLISATQSSRSVDIAVQDNGQGIAAGFLPYVFDRFRQGDQSIDRRHGGLGLGLTIVKHLVELHGGTVRAESNGEGHGATFVVSLPRQAVTAPLQSLIELPRRPHAGEMISAPDFTEPSGGVAFVQGRKVLVVDDDADNCEFVARILDECGVKTCSATSGEEGLRLITEFQPDLVISDVSMPGMNGYEFVRRIRASDGEQACVPCLALTAYARSEDRVKALRAGFDDHLSKPFDAVQLAKALLALQARSGKSTVQTEQVVTGVNESRPSHILLAEDNATVAGIIKTGLQESGYRVSVVASVADGVQVAESESVDILLSDLRLRDGMGWDLLARIQGDRRIPAIAMSGYSEEAYAETCRRAGFSEYRIKPVDTDDLTKAVARLLQ